MDKPKKQYLISELREILFDKINTLIKLDPYWRKCIRCQNHGKCCVGADITIRTDEWIVIKEYISKLSVTEKEILRINIQNKIFCPFRAPNKCLIHEVRPMNCIWTPFQLAQNINNGDITYSMLTNDCSFKNITKENMQLLDDKIEYVQAKSFNEERLYLFLNNFVIHYENNPNFQYINISELINEVLSLIC